MSTGLHAPRVPPRRPSRNRACEAHRATPEPSRPDADRDAVATLLDEALALFDRDRAAARRHVESARLIVCASANDEEDGHAAGWQVRRAQAFIRDNLGASLRIETVARLVRLSASHFSRLFKSTTGVAYSDFVAAARIDLAKKLLLTTDAPISDVALACGLADQSHLTRVFGRAVGLPPSAWRRRLKARSEHEARHVRPVGRGANRPVAETCVE